MSITEERLKELLTSGVVKTKAGWYYNIEGKNIGHKEDVLNFYTEDLVEDEVLPDQEDTLEASNQPLNSNDSKQPALSNPKLEALDNKVTDYGALLGKVRKVVVGGNSGQNLDIRINGIDSRLKDNKVIKECPLEFMWREKDNMISDGGSGFYNGDWTVVDKSQAKGFLSVNRDDTPEENYYVIKEMVLCCMHKTDYIASRKRRVVGNILRPKKVKNQRNEEAKRIAKSSNDASNLISSFKSANARDNKNFSDSVKEIDSLSLDQQLEAAKELVSADDF